MSPHTIYIVLYHFDCTAASLASSTLALTPIWCGRFQPRPVAGVMLVALALFAGVVTLDAGGQSSCGNDISRKKMVKLRRHHAVTVTVLHHKSYMYMYIYIYSHVYNKSK